MDKRLKHFFRSDNLLPDFLIAVSFVVVAVPLWLFLHFWSLLIFAVLAINWMILIAHYKKISIPFLSDFVAKEYERIKGKASLNKNIFQAKYDLKVSLLKSLRHFVLLLGHDLEIVYFKFLHYLALLFRSLEDNHELLIDWNQSLKTELGKKDFYNGLGESWPEREAYRQEKAALFQTQKRRALHISAFGSLAVVAIAFALSIVFAPQTYATTFGWIQSSWSGNASVIAVAVHPGDRTSWNKYYSKDTAIEASSSVSINATTTITTYTSDSDFSTNNNSVNAYVSNGSISMHVYQIIPTFSPVAGEIAFGTTVNIDSSGADAIYYTTDGSTPTIASTNQATTPLVINASETVKALAVKAGWHDSLIGSATYTQASTANLSNLVLSNSPANYTFAGSTYTYNGVVVLNAVSSVTITPTGAGVIMVEGTQVASGQASAGIALTAGVQKTITIIVTETGKLSKTYTIYVTRNAGVCATPTFNPTAGAVDWGTGVTISSSGADAIYYTTDGSDPTQSSTNQANTPLVINSVETVKALAVKAGWEDSAIGSAAYTQTPATVPSAITLAVGSTNPVGGVTNVSIPAAGETDTTGAVTGWISSGADNIKFTVTDNGGTSGITINGAGYTSGNNYPIGAASPLTIVVTTTETGKATGVRTFTVSVTAFVCGTTVAYDGGQYNAAGSPVINGGYYRTLLVNTQCWFKENLMTTKKPNGSAITRGAAGGGWNGVDNGYYAYPPNTSNNAEETLANIKSGNLGFVYQWSAAMNGSAVEGARGICPAGWHIPTDAQQYTLENYLKDSGQACVAGRNNAWSCNSAGGKLKSGGTSGMDIPLAGYRNYDGSFIHRTTGVYIWSSTASGNAWERYLDASEDRVYRNAYGNTYGFSVRCLKN